MRQRLCGSVNRLIYICLIASRHFGEDFAVGWIDGRERVAFGALHPFAIDKHLALSISYNYHSPCALLLIIRVSKEAGQKACHRRENSHGLRAQRLPPTPQCRLLGSRLGRLSN
jgi:hypothetical protein